MANAGTFNMGLGIFYALAAALIWGASPVLVKRGLRRANVSAAVILQQLGAVSTLIVILLVPVHEVDWAIPVEAVLTFMAVGLVGSFFGRVFLLRGVDELGASRAQSFANSAPLLTAVYAVFLLGETATPVIFVGIALIVTGLILITHGATRSSSARPMSYRAFFNPFMSIAFFGFGPILKKLAVTLGGGAVVGALITHSTGFVLLALFGRFLRIDWRSGIRVPRASWCYLLLSGLFQGVGSIFTYLAVSHAPAMVVAPIWNVQPLVTFSLAHLVLKGDEVVTIRDGLAAGIIVAGVYFLYQA